MSEWAEEKLGALTSIEIGGTPSRERVDYWAAPEDDGYPWVSIADLGNRVIFDTKERITELGLRNSNVKKVPAGTLMMSFKLTIGRSGIAGSDLYTNEAIAAFVPRDSRIDPAYLAHVLPGIAQRAIADTAVKGVTLNKQKLRDLVISFPKKLREQQHIAEILSTVDQTIEQTEALIAKTQQIKAGLMHDLFTRGVAADGQLRPPREEAPQLYKESSLGWIPKGWQYDYLSGLTTRIVDGVHHTPNYVDHGVPFVTVKNLTRSRSIDFEDLNYISHRDHREFIRRADPKVGDVLVTKDGTLGVSRLVEAWHPEFSIFVSVALLRPVASCLHPQMLHMFFDSGAYKRQLGHLSAGTGLKHIHLEHFRRFVVPLPKFEEQDRIGLIAGRIETKLQVEERQLEKLQKIKRGLMQDLVPVVFQSRSTQ